MVSGYLFAAAKAGNVTAQIFWLKTRAHWREKSAPDDLPPGNDAGSNSPVVLLPDNSRDPELTQVLHDAQQKYFAQKPARSLRDTHDPGGCKPVRTRRDHGHIGSGVAS